MECHPVAFMKMIPPTNQPTCPSPNEHGWTVTGSLKWNKTQPSLWISYCIPFIHLSFVCLFAAWFLGGFSGLSGGSSSAPRKPGNRISCSVSHPGDFLTSKEADESQRLIGGPRLCVANSIGWCQWWGGWWWWEWLVTGGVRGRKPSGQRHMGDTWWRRPPDWRRWYQCHIHRFLHSSQASVKSGPGGPRRSLRCLWGEIETTAMDEWEPTQTKQEIV